MRIRDYRFKTVLYDEMYAPAGDTSLRDGPVNSNTIRIYVPCRVSSRFTRISHAEDSSNDRMAF